MTAKHYSEKKKKKKKLLGLIFAWIKYSDKKKATVTIDGDIHKGWKKLLPFQHSIALFLKKNVSIFIKNFI